MSDIKDWDPESGSAFNADAPPDGAPEGMPPSAVNDVMREIMAASRRQWERAEWFEYGHDITRTSGTTFNVDGDDKTSLYTVGRRVRIRGIATGTLLGTITASTFSVVTSVTIEPDAGTIANEAIEVELGIANPSGASVGVESVAGLSGVLDDLQTAIDNDIDAAKSEAISEARVPAGAVEAFAMNLAPTGWLKANGAAVSRTTYAALFSVIGTTFGAGDGSTTFNLPDLRGEFVRGWDDNRSVDTGRDFGSAQLDQMERIIGRVNNIRYRGALGPSGALHVTAIRNSPADSGGADARPNFDLGFDSQLSSARVGTETRGRNVALLYCIKF